MTGNVAQMAEMTVHGVASLTFRASVKATPTLDWSWRTDAKPPLKCDSEHSLMYIGATKAKAPPPTPALNEYKKNVIF